MGRPLAGANSQLKLFLKRWILRFKKDIFGSPADRRLEERKNTLVFSAARPKN
jgi:hypothetical protein